MNLAIKNLTIAYKSKSFEKRIFEGVSLEFKPGINVLQGESGSGKTTLLKAIAGDFPIREGSFYFDTEKLSLNSDLLKDIYYPRNLFYDEYRLIDNLTLAALMEKESWKTTNETVLSLIPKSLNDHLLTKYKLLSSGQRQLVDLTLIDYFKPKLILLDEPTANLSMEEYQEFVKFLDRLPITTIVLVASNDERLISLQGYDSYKVKDKMVVHA